MKMRKMTAREAEELARRDRNKLILLLVAAVLVAGAFVAAQFREGDVAEDDLVSETPDVPAREESIELLEFESPELLDDIRDRSELERSSLESAPLLAVFEHARRQTAQHLDALGIVEFDADVAQRILADPAGHRLDPLLVRGEVLDVGRRRRPGGTRDDWIATLRSDSGAVAHVLFAEPPPRESGASVEAPLVDPGDFLRVDGLFHAILRRQVGGAPIDAPLVLAHAARRSVPLIDESLAMATPALADVVDDQVGDVRPIDQEALWQLMARAKFADEKTDWEGAQEIDQETLSRIYTNGDLYRGTPFTFSLSLNMGSHTERAEENALHIDRVSRGWIGNVMWKDPVPVVQWVAPYTWKNLFEFQDENQARFIVARGWFFKNVVYEMRGGKPGRAPLFVMAGVEPRVPEEDTLTNAMMWGVLGLTVLVVGIILVLLRADKRRSAALQDELLRRRRERRENTAVPA